MSFKPGELVEVFHRTPYGIDNGHEALDEVGGRWLHCPSPKLGANRPRTGWSERWLPAVVEQAVPGAQVRIRWDVRLWYDWASGERMDTTFPGALSEVVHPGRVRPRGLHWSLSGHSPTELQIGGAPVSVSFVVFRWGAARIPIQFDAHSWGADEGSTVSARFVQTFFDGAVVPRLGWDYEVLTVYVQRSDDFASISPEFLSSICRGRHVVSLYFLWPIQGQQLLADKVPSTAAYLDAGLFFDLVGRMEASGLVTRWPHHLQLWRRLASKDFLPSTSIVPKYHVPLTTCVPRSLILVDPLAAAVGAIAALWYLQLHKEEGGMGPTHADWAPDEKGRELCVAKLGYSYEGVDVRMTRGPRALADALDFLVSQPGYTNECVYVQQRVRRVDVEARCFVMGGAVVATLYTRFARIDGGGCVRDYEKALGADEAMSMWFYADWEAWHSALDQIRVLTRRWHAWLLAHSAEPAVSLRIDYLLERVAPGKAEVWASDVGEQGYSMGSIDPSLVFGAVLDSILGTHRGDLGVDGASVRKRPRLEGD